MTLGVAAAALVVLAVLGLGVEGKLRPTSLEVEGTRSSRANALLEEHFGDSAPFAILLEGPAVALDTQGPAVARSVRAEGATVLSPWEGERLRALRPAPRRALILADFHVDSAAAVAAVVPRLDELLGETVAAPVSARQTGFATLSRAIQEESVDSTRTAELVAVPFLLLILLLVFRTPVAALIPLLFGAAAVLSTRGLLALAAARFEVDGLALTVATMMGLALGVDYALLMVSRFREELASGAAPLAAASATRATAGRTTAFAGSTLALAMLVTLLVMPGSLFLSLAATAILVTAVSVAISFFLAPPLLYLLAPTVDRWWIGGRSRSPRLLGAVSKALRRPALAAAVIGVALLLLALPAIGLRTGPPSPEQLPTSSQARQDTEAIAAAIGAGWDAPYLVVVASPRGPITTPRHLASVERVERRIAADPGVQAVIGIGRIDHRTAPLREEGNELLAGEGEASPERLAELGASLDRAAGGVGRLRGGIAEASAGAGLLGSGSARAGEGASRISDAAGRAASAARRALGALGRLDHGSARLAEGQRQAALGSRALRDELAGLMPVIRSGAIRPARRLRAELRAAAATDPSLRSALRDAEGVLEALTLARNQANRARVGAVRLHRGQRQLAGGGERLHSGVSRLSDAAAALPSGLARLGGGAAELSQGLQRLTGGADALSRNLAAGFDRSQPLQGGLDRARTKVKGSAARLSRKVDALRQGSPGIFDSGYFTLSALAGAPAADRRRAGEVLDLTGGGQAAQLVVVPRSTFNTPGSRALNRRLTSYAASLMGEGGLQAGVTGGPALVDDYDEAISARVPLVVLVTTLATFVVLLLVLRALPLAAIAVGLNLLTVAVAFGVLTLLFDVPAGWPLGGHTYVDSIGAAGIFGIIFGLSIDYAVFLLVRVRECRDRGASNATAITEGLGRTAGVITGAAAIMLIVFVAFAGAPIATVSQLGTGLAIAVLLDATVVRLVLLPALMLLVGDRVWWLPAGLGRVLPKLGTARG